MKTRKFTISQPKMIAEDRWIDSIATQPGDILTLDVAGRKHRTVCVSVDEDDEFFHLTLELLDTTLEAAINGRRTETERKRHSAVQGWSR